MWKSLLTVFALVIAASLILAAAPAALAQVPSEQCNGPGAMPATLTLNPQSGPAGSVTSITGTFMPPVLKLDAEAPTPSLQQEGLPVHVWWLETGFGDALGVGDFPITIDEDEVLHFGGAITIPGSSAPGPHQIALAASGDEDPACLTFTVTAAAGQDAYQMPAVLPSTGSSASFWPLIFAGGLAMAGAAMLFINRRRSIRRDPRED